jgi:predicted PurR-regulated permease PerM
LPIESVYHDTQRMLGTASHEARSSRLLSLIATILVVAVLFLAREVLIPIALALLLAFLLSPLVTRLQRWRVPRVAAVLLVSVFAFSVIGVIGYVVATEAFALTESLPQYRENIREKARALARPGFFWQARENIAQATEEVMKAATQPESAPDSLPAEVSGSIPGEHDSDAEPVPVEVVESEPNPLESLGQAIIPLFGPLGTAGIVVIFVVFMLIQREDLRDRLIALSGSEHIHLTTQAIDDAAKRVSRFLLMQMIVNVTYGIAAGAGLLILGVPNAILWGVLCAVLRYIPYVGPWLGAAPPILLSLAVFDGWSRPLMVMGMFVVLELVSNNVVEPLLYGSGTGVSSMAVLLAAVFWTWLWGVSGLVLSTPLTVCVVVIGRHFPRARWLAILLGDEPGLPLPARVYQRLLAADQEEVFDLAQAYLKDHSLLQWYDDVLIPALSMAEADRHEGALESQRQQVVYATASELIDDLRHESGKRSKEEKPEEVDAASVAADSESRRSQAPALVIAAHDRADELVGRMLAQMMNASGQRAEALGTGGLASEVCEQAAKRNPSIICISSMPPMAIGHARYMGKRVRERMPDVRLVVGLWNASDPERAAQRMDVPPETTIVRTLAEALEALRR